MNVELVPEGLAAIRRGVQEFGNHLAAVGADGVRTGIIRAGRFNRVVIHPSRIENGHMIEAVDWAYDAATGEWWVGVDHVDYTVFQEEGTRYIKGAHFVRDAALTLSLGESA